MKRTETVKKLICIAIVLLTFCSFDRTVAQNSMEIHFMDQNMTAALKKAKASNKLIFVDCYTSWCSPCKWMADNIFTLDSVAQFYNDHFVNLAMDMEKGIGPGYTKKYNVQVFPTYLFLDGAGTLIHKSTSRMDAAEFMDEGRRALSPDRSSSILAEKYEQGDRSLFTLLNYIEVLQKLNRKKADSLKTVLVATVTDAQLKTPLGWKAVSELATDLEGTLYRFMKENETYFRTQYGDSAVDAVTGRCLLRKLYGLSREDKKEAFFSTLKQLKSLPEPEHKVNAAQVELDYYITNDDLRTFTAISKKYASTLLKDDDATLSFIARRAEYADNKGFLKPAYRLAKQAVTINPENYSNQGTLAEICYSLGKKREAVKAAKKAYALSLQDSSKIQKIAKKLLEKTQNM